MFKLFKKSPKFVSVEEWEVYNPRRYDFSTMHSQQITTGSKEHCQKFLEDNPDHRNYRIRRTGDFFSVLAK